MKKILIFAACILALSFLLLKVFHPKTLDEHQIPALKQKIRFNIVSDPCSLDPKKARNLNDLNLIKMFHEGLFRIGFNGTITNGLCESYTLSDDRLQYIFKIKEAFWSNGEKIRAYDFLSSWQQALDPSFGSDYAFLLYPIKNASEIKKGSKSLSSLGVRAIDDKELLVELEKPTPYFLELLTNPIYFPTKKEDNSSDSFLFSGPFCIKLWDHSNNIIATKNRHFWDSLNVLLDEVEMVMVSCETGFSMFLNNELDWEGSPYSLIPLDAIESHSNKILSDDFLITSFLRLNVDDHLLKDSRMRVALHEALNKKEIVDAVLHGRALVATGLVPPSLKEGIQQTSSSPITYLEKKPGKLTLSFLSSEKNYRIAQILQDQWNKKLGIKVLLEPLESKVFFSNVSDRKYQIALGSWTCDFRDPISFLEVFKTKNIGTNNTGWENNTYQTLLNSSINATDEIRKALLNDSEKILLDESPIIPLYHGKLNYIKNPKLKNVVLASTGSIDFRWAFIDQ